MNIIKQIKPRGKKMIHCDLIASLNFLLGSTSINVYRFR